MVRRKARRGAHAGSSFWGCSRYPSCTGIRSISRNRASTTSSLARKRNSEAKVVKLSDSAAATTANPRRVDESLIALIGARVAEWKEQLMDLSRRNNLLFFRETKTQHLDLTKGNYQELRRLLAGESVSIDKLFLTNDNVSVVSSEARRRVRSVLSKAIENYEERSLETLYVGVGECTWDYEQVESTIDTASNLESKSPPRAPLLLVPATVQRGQRKGDFNLTLDVSEAEVNPVLAYVMKKDHGIQLEIPDTLDNDTEVSLDIKLNALSSLLSQAPGGSVKDGVQLSNFSYAKLAMVQDLDAGIQDMTTHNLILALADNKEALSEVRGNLEDPQLDEPNRISPDSEYLILDADSSQNMVINAISNGQSFAFDGPPGTGKSQTIANAIAVLIASKKKVLFVAEKRAAIDAVMKRLQNVGLADLVMDYHGTTRKKKDIIANLRTTKNILNSYRSSFNSPVQSELKRERDQLVNASFELHCKRSPWNLSIYDLLSIRAANFSGSETKFRFNAKNLEAVDLNAIDHIESLIRNLWNLGGFIDSKGAKMWREAQIDSREAAEKLLDALEDVSAWRLKEIEQSFEGLSESIDLEKLQFSELQVLARIISSAKPIQNVWGSALFNSDVAELRAKLDPAKNIFRNLLATLFNPKYRKAKKDFQALTGKKAKAKEALLAVTAIDVINDVWRQQLRLTSEFPDVSDNPLVEQAAAANRNLEEACESLAALKPLVEKLKVNVNSAREIATDLLDEKQIAVNVYRIHHIVDELNSFGLERLVDESKKSRAEIDLICSRLRYGWAHSLIERLGAGHLNINKDASKAFENSAENFRKLDKKHIKDTPSRIIKIWASYAAEIASKFPAEEAALVNALNKKRKLPPITQLFKQSRNCISSLKPCWVMSPLSVSMLRPPCEWFDVVIFDEASQIPPADAITAIKAGKQVVVAGDDRQLPPTSFFAAGDPKDDDGTDEDVYVDDIQVGNYESILAAMKSIVTKPRQLLWHYRSRDERLIAFSNNRIYKSLITFPDADQDGALNFENVGNNIDAISKGATNKAEIKKVIELIIAHATTRPNESLGVIALGSPHAIALENAIYLARDSYPELDSFLESNRDEPFFVKNLERVQGDERDAIILTVGYGRNEKGEIRYNFGPINGKNGERRLNVATTRAKRRLTLVATFNELDLDPKQCASSGMSFLRDYLGYVRSGGSNFGDTGVIKPAINPFERSIQERLEREGFDLVPQYGVGKYLIDFAVRDPKDSSKFLLAIECDGASYHSQPTARERDRLRQELLEDRGWRFHRIWSTDWFRDPDLEVRKCKEAISRVV